MKQTEFQFSVSTKGRGIYAISNKVENWVQNQNIRSGLLTLFIPHTSVLTHSGKCRPGCLERFRSVF